MIRKCLHLHRLWFFESAVISYKTKYLKPTQNAQIENASSGADGNISNPFQEIWQSAC